MTKATEILAAVKPRSAYPSASSSRPEDFVVACCADGRGRNVRDARITSGWIGVTKGTPLGVQQNRYEPDTARPW